MSGEEQNRAFYKDTFREISVPKGLAEKVGRITEGDVKSRRDAEGSVMRKVLIAVAVLAVLFVGSNGIAYAMTGETWVETIIVRRNIDGIDYEVEAEARELRNGEIVYVGEIELESGKKASFLEHDGEGPTMYLILEEEGAEICSYGGRTYILDGEIELDITEDYADDGHAKGIYEVNGVFKKYGLRKLEDGRISCCIQYLPKDFRPDDMR